MLFFLIFEVFSNLMIPWFYCRTWFSRHGGVGLMVGLDDLRGLSNLNDSMLLFRFFHCMGVNCSK